MASQAYNALFNEANHAAGQLNSHQIRTLPIIRHAIVIF